MSSVSLIHVYDPSVPSKVPKINSISTVKAYCETNNVFDTSAYPPTMPSLILLNTWLQKNLAAREAVISFFKETKNEDIEVSY